MIIIVIAAVLLFLSINGYIAWHAWSAFKLYSNTLAGIIPFFIILSAAMLPLARLLEQALPFFMLRFMYIWGAYWLGTMFYSFLILLVIDVIRLIKTICAHFFVMQLPALNMLWAVLLLLLALNIYGTWNARQPVINEYHITLAKKGSTLDTLKTVMVSDTHLGWVNRQAQLDSMVQRINSLRPDIVFMAGDILDEGIDPAFRQTIIASLSAVKAPLGIYAVLGNHEYISGQQEMFFSSLAQAGVHALRDEWILLDQALYIVGRDDASGSRFSENRRKNLEALTAEIDAAGLPVILLDHQPSELVLAGSTDIDLQFSGHTHRGQLFPNHLITGKIFAQDWGYYQQNSFQAIVSSGYGTWGPPLRIGSHPEIVVAHLTFK
jgi:predicted MPP superfamily phosphohydrolase